jgi:hypothetical protein
MGDLLDIERQECVLVWQAQAQSLPVEHRDCSPLAILGCRLMTAAATRIVSDASLGCRPAGWTAMNTDRAAVRLACGYARRIGANLHVSSARVSNIWSPAGRSCACMYYYWSHQWGWHICPHNLRLDPHIARLSLLLPLS